LALVLLAACGLGIVIVPALIIQPFRAQTPTGMQVGYLLRAWSPIATVIIAAAALAVVVFTWRGTTRWWSKTLLLVLFTLTLPPVWFARQNHFEWMFHPLPGPNFAKVADTTFVEDSDKVIAVEMNGEAAAYPVRQIAYHHIVQDEVGGVPIAATY
jgi:hypothetical protein